MAVLTWLVVSVALANPLQTTDPSGADGTGSEGDGSAERTVDWSPAEIAPVTGGDDAPEGAWPDAVAVYMKDGGYTFVGCTGTLVAPDVVFTAGHCVRGVEIPKVRIGSVWADSGGEVIDVIDVYEYPDSQRTGYDFAVLVLDQDSSYDPRPIATDCIEPYIEDGAEVAVVGWGATDYWGNQYTDRLQEGFTEVTDHDCSATSRGCNSSVSPNGEIGAGGDGVDSCYGDSGGPLYLLTDRGDYLVGITSRAFYDVNKPCGEGGIYVRADAVLEWAEEKAGRELTRPVCGTPPEPVAETLYVPAEGVGDTRIDPQDADSDSFEFRMVSAPVNGSAEVMADGTVRYTVIGDYVGADVVVVEVTDETGLSADVEVPVQVLTKREYRKTTGEGTGCGCVTPTAPAVGWAVGLGLLAALRRRRNA